MLAVPGDWLRSSAASWAERRQGPDALSVTLEKRRIYILPSRFGLAYGATVFAMLLGAVFVPVLLAGWLSLRRAVGMRGQCPFARFQ